MNRQEPDLTACDREPIHIPGSIQPHGLLLVIETDSMTISHVAGDVEARLGVTDWLGAAVASVLGETTAEALAKGETTPLRGVTPPASRESFDLTIHPGEGRFLVELEPAAPLTLPTTLLARIEAAARRFEQAAGIAELAQAAAHEFRELTGFDRVMVYRFLDDGSGKVVGEHIAPGQQSFLHHHFPASDIPAQARALYVRNLVRVIPDVNYTPAPLRPARSPDEPLDMSDCDLRSVSPVHIQYLKNMNVAASASVSIVKDGVLWGLIACHHSSPRGIPADMRAACRGLAGSLARRIKAREDTDAYRERVRLRTYEDRIVELLLRSGSLDTSLSIHLHDIQQMLDSDGIAVLRGEEVVCGGKCPPDADVRALADWIMKRGSLPVFATNSLNELRLSEAGRPLAAGVLAMPLSVAERWVVLWFRAEEVEIIEWAGNPHKPASVGTSGKLTPRASFDAWRETVRGKARRWTIPEIEAAERLAVAVTNVWQTRRIRDLNKELMNVIAQKEALVQQREYLLGEVNHRVQNSLQLVSSFLALQARETEDAAGRAAIEEARRRIAAVSLVHRRLYSAEQIKTIDAARYLDELLDELASSMGDEWRGQIARDLQPILLPNDRAITLGLVLTELTLNANKYAYGGAPGPIRVSLTEEGNTFRLTVTDQGSGRSGTERKGFGSRMIDALVKQLGGTLGYAGNQPGTRVTLSAPIESKPS